MNLNFKFIIFRLFVCVCMYVMSVHTGHVFYYEVIAGHVQ